MNVMASAQEVATRLISGVLPIFLLRFWLRSFLQHHALLFKFLYIRVRVFFERLQARRAAEVDSFPLIVSVDVFVYGPLHHGTGCLIRLL